MNEEMLSDRARRSLRRDGWYPGRKCDAAQLEMLHARLQIGGGAPPCREVWEFVEEMGGLVLHRTSGFPLVGFNGVRYANFRLQPHYELKTPEMMCDIRRVVGHVYGVGSYSNEGWSLHIDNSLRFFGLDPASDQAFLLAESIPDFFDDVYNVRMRRWIEIGVVQWSQEDV